jgi:adenylosuccinate lyase
VERNAMRSFAEQRDFKALLLADPDVTKHLSTSALERAFELDEQFRHIDQIFDRVFQPDPAQAALSRS